MAKNSDVMKQNKDFELAKIQMKHSNRNKKYKRSEQKN